MSDADPLVLEGVRKRYGTRTVLPGVSLRVQAGRTIVLRGPNGAGKSTLLGCIAGTVIADEGRIAIAGHDLEREPLRARAALRYLPQEPEVPAGLSGHELLQFCADVHDDPRGVAKATAQLGFAAALPRFASTYSVGMRRQLMFAALLPGRSRLWVLDEPFAGVDADGRERIRRAIRRALDEGIGVVIAAHDRDLDDVERLDPQPFELGAPPEDEEASGPGAASEARAGPSEPDEDSASDERA